MKMNPKTISYTLLKNAGIFELYLEDFERLFGRDEEIVLTREFCLKYLKCFPFYWKAQNLLSENGKAKYDEIKYPSFKIYQQRMDAQAEINQEEMEPFDKAAREEEARINEKYVDIIKAIHEADGYLPKVCIKEYEAALRAKSDAYFEKVNPIIERNNKAIHAIHRDYQEACALAFCEAFNSDN